MSSIFVILLPLLVFDIDYSFYFLLFLLPNERMFSQRTGGQTFVALYILLLALKVLIRRRRIEKSVLLGGVLVIVFMLLKNFYFANSFFDTDLLRLMANSFIFISVVSRYRNGIYNTALRSVIWYAVGTFVAGLLGLLHRLSLGQTLPIMLLYRFSGIKNDSNFYALSVALAVSLSLIVCVLHNGQSIRYIFLALALFVLGAMSTSRGYLVASIPSFFLFVIAFFKFSSKAKVFLLIVMLMLILVSGLLDISFFDYLLRGYSTRLSDDDVSGGRFGYWAAYIETIASDARSLVFGLGRFDKQIFSTQMNIGGVAHNILLGSLATYGLLITISITIMFFLVFSRFRRLFGNARFSIYFCLPFSTVFLGFMFLDGITSNLFFYGFCLSLLGGYLLSVPLEST